MGYSTIKITDAQKEVIDKMRIPRPDVGPKSYEKTLLIVIADVIAKAVKYDKLIDDDIIIKAAKYDELMNGK